MTHRADSIVVGAGIFGITAAVELARRGQRVTVIDPGPLPHPLAASTDISKIVRTEYGADEGYMAMAERARDGWLAWNAELGRALYREIGILMLTRSPMVVGGFEHDSYVLLQRRGHAPERVDGDEILRRYPIFQPGVFVDGFFHRAAGYVDSGRAVAALVTRAAERGVDLRDHTRVTRLLGDDRAVTGVETAAGERLDAGSVIVAAGAWTPVLVPELAPVMTASGQPVFHLTLPDMALFQPDRLPVFTADIGASGWYGFPVHPSAHVIKVAHHGAGSRLHPDDAREVTDGDIARMRGFFADAIPSLATAEVALTRRCLYCDTLDQQFWIGAHPERRGLVVAAGGSGHGFKFAPILGALIADCVDGAANPLLDRFGWRQLGPETVGTEAARYRGDE